MDNTTVFSTIVLADVTVETTLTPSTGKALSPADQTLVFQLLDPQVSITVPLRERIVLGRKADNTVIPVDVDLSPHGAYKKGVSRLHAALSRVYHNLFITDMGSANGTYLNGQKLVPHQERIVRDGDEIMLGNLRLRLHFDEGKNSKAT